MASKVWMSCRKGNWLVGQFLLHSVKFLVKHCVDLHRLLVQGPANGFSWGEMHEDVEDLYTLFYGGDSLKCWGDDILHHYFQVLDASTEPGEGTYMDSSGSYQLQVKIGSGNGLVPSGNKPLPEPILTNLDGVTIILQWSNIWNCQFNLLLPINLPTKSNIKHMKWDYWKFLSNQ